MDDEIKVTHADAELVMCDYTECSDFGEYGRCYFDIFKNCKRYNEYMEMLERRHKHVDTET